MSSRIALSLFLICLAISFCSSVDSMRDDRLEETISADSTVVLQGVSLLTMEEDGVRHGQTVVIRDGHIEAVGDRDHLAIPAGAVVIDAGNRYLMPGLFDMHVHVQEGHLNEFLANGITGVRNMWGTEGVVQLRERIGSGALAGPGIYSASPGIDGNSPVWPGTQVVEDTAEVAPLLNRLQSEEWAYLKVYNSLRPSVYRAISDEARRRGMKVVGHVPVAVSIASALKQGQYSIEHLTGYDQLLGGVRGYPAWTSIDEGSIANVVELTRRSGTWNCPTLVVLDALSRQLGEEARRQAEENRFLLVKALHDAGAPLLAGTDAGVQHVGPGESLHEELEKLVRAGLTPMEVLRIATRDAARFLGEEDRLGSIREGKRAHLVLLEDNPLDDIRNLSSIRGIFLDGTWYPRSRFDQ